jgi:glycerol-3-phosphate O-acyltransferase 3/4
MYRSQVLNTSEILRDAADALIDDSFFRCFTSAPPDLWNWNWYLFPSWLLGVFLRYFILFPIRLILLVITQTVFMALFFPVQFVLKVLADRVRLLKLK